jgi:hypothetical protein
MKCIACGSEAMIAGTVRENGGGAEVRFYPSDRSLLKQLFLSSSSREVRSYGCLHCHHLQFAVDFNEGDLERYQQFEGEQPGVLERINSDPKKLED